MSVEHTTDVAIVGGGVIGSTLAYFLRKADVAVTVIERAEIAAESSSAAAGLLAPLGGITEPGAFTDLILASRALILERIPELEELSGKCTEYDQCGSLRWLSLLHR